MLSAALLASLVSLSPVDRLDHAHSFRCLTPHLLPLPRYQRVQVIPQPLADDKSERDAWGSYPNMLTTDNFALKWGDSGGITQATAEYLVQVFEESWQVEVVDMGMAAPTGAGTYLFNVYLGDTGSGTPPTYGAGGYFYYDDDGHPMIVINPDSLWDDDGARSVAPHEFFHALEDASGSYSGYEGVGAWYWEASAEWAVGEVYPDLTYQGSFLGGYAMVPHYPLGHFDYPDEGDFLEMHQYGAFIFPRYLSEHEFGSTFVRDSWTQAGFENDPLVVIDRLLGDHGTTLDETFVRFAAHNATLDYAAHNLYQQIVDGTAQYYPEWDYRVSDQVPSTGTDGWRDAPADTLPRRYGYNVIELVAPEEGNLTVELEGATVGSHGSAANLGATLVRDLGAGREYVTMELVDNAGVIELPGVGAETSIWLVVAASSDRAIEGETFDYRYRMEVHAPAPPPNPIAPSEPSRYYDQGGCRTTPGSVWLAPALVFLVLRRRR